MTTGFIYVLLNPAFPGENQVGCDNRHEGEQFQPEGKDQISAGIAEAIQMSIHGIAPRIQL
jgi:hypothetical protein